MTDKFVINYIDKKISESEDVNYIVYGFYELKIKNNLSEDEIQRLI